MRHEDRLADNRRMGMMFNLLRKMDSGEKASIEEQADRYLRNIDNL